jgi:hypothetical protein
MQVYNTQFRLSTDEQRHFVAWQVDEETASIVVRSREGGGWRVVSGGDLMLRGRSKAHAGSPGGGGPPAAYLGGKLAGCAKLKSAPTRGTDGMTPSSGGLVWREAAAATPARDFEGGLLCLTCAAPYGRIGETATSC